MTYPAAAPTLSGDLLTISRFLQNPTNIRRRLRDFRDLRFVSDQILTARFRSSGGAVLYEQSEPFVTDRTVEPVNPGGEYPFAETPTGTAALAAVVKWGQKVRITEEEVERETVPSVLDRKLRKLVNSIIKQVDGVTMAALESAVTQNTAATTAWGTIATATPFYDIQKAKAQIRKLNMGYKPDTIVMDDDRYAALTNNQIVSGLLKRETSDNPIYTGEIEKIAGLTIVVTPNLPVTSTVYVVDSTQIGGMADEGASLPGYNVSDMAVFTKVIEQAEIDAVDIQGRRKTVPVIQEPGAAWRITGA
jgi:hypothetical protein